MMRSTQSSIVIRPGVYPSEGGHPVALDEVLWLCLEETELWGTFRVSKLFDI